jgi:predicted kinase
VVAVNLPFACPKPGAAIDWDRFDYPWIAPMAACVQDPVHHAEGDVWTHTRMVCEELVRLPEWQALPRVEREVVFAAAVLHDVAKPDCTRVEGGHVRHPSHSPRGAIMARRILWELDAPIGLREQVCGLIRFHQTPFFLLDHPDPVRKAALVSYIARCDQLAILARADALGRICGDVQRILDNIALFAEFCGEQGCLTAPFPFPSDHSRFLYFRTPGRDPSYHAYDDTAVEAVLMSGLPGAGKSRWVAANLDLPVVCLDDIRSALKVRPTDDQGKVVDHAREQAREHLRRAEPFVWNATNVSRELRARLIDLVAEYNARVRIVYVEPPRERLLRQNPDRSGAVPEMAVERMLRSWDVPDLTEAHQVDIVT